MGQIGAPRKVGQRLAVAALTLGMIGFGTACSSGSTAKPIALRTATGKAGSSRTGAASGGGSPSATAGGAGSAASSGGATTPGGTTTSGGASAAGTAGATGASPAATTTPGSATTSAAAPKKTTPTTRAAAPPPSTGPTPTAAGTYNYAGSGTSTLTTSKGATSTPASATATLTVSGSSDEEWVNPVSTLNLEFNSGGVFLTSETVEGVSCVFSSPVAWPPWPAASGASFSGQATCGSSVLSLQGHVGAHTSVTLGDGASESVFVVTSTLTVGSDLTVGETDWYAPSLRLPVKTAYAISGSYGSYSLATNTSYTLTAP